MSRWEFDDDLYGTSGTGKVEWPGGELVVLRHGKNGRFFERRVENCLQIMQEVGEISSFERHEPNSPADIEGRDFTLKYLSKRGELVAISFGVTLNSKSRRKAVQKHPTVPQVRFLERISDEGIRAKIRELLL